MDAALVGASAPHCTPSTIDLVHKTGSKGKLYGWKKLYLAN